MHDHDHDPAAAVTRVHPEPFTYVEEATVHAALTAAPVAALDHVEQALAALVRGDLRLDLPSKVIVEDPEDGGGDFRAMPCVVRGGGHALKVVKIIGTNVAQQSVPDQITVGKAFVLHPVENYITHIIEACLLSSARTGMCAALATRHLAASRRRVRIIGAGRVGYYCAVYLAALGDVDEILFSDRDGERAAVAAAAATATVPGSTTFAAAVAGAAPAEDVLVVATTSSAPVCGPEDTPAALVVSVGADTVTQHELDDAWPAVADVYTDSQDSFRVGDLLGWIDRGAVQADCVPTLLSLLRDGARESGRRRVFVSTGSALMDNLAVGYLLARDAATSSATAATTEVR